MGHTVNPISNRLGVSIFWKSKWCTYTDYNYKYLVLTDLVFYKFLFLLERSFLIKRLRIIIESWSLYYHNTRFFFHFKYRSIHYIKRKPHRQRRLRLRRKHSRFQRKLWLRKRIRKFFRRLKKRQKFLFRVVKRLKFKRLFYKRMIRFRIKKYRYNKKKKKKTLKKKKL